MTGRVASDLRDLAVVCPVHNQVDRVDTLMSRLARLAERGAQVLLVDDASSDGTTQRLRATQAPLDVILLGHNQGPAAARNIALERVTRDYVWFCDSDDEWETEGPATMLRHAHETGADLVVARAVLHHEERGWRRVVDVVDDPRPVDGVTGLGRMLTGIWHGYLWDKLFRHELVAGLCFPSLRSQSDFVFTFDAVRAAEVVAPLPVEVYTHVLRDGSVSQSGHTQANLRYCLDHVEASLPEGHSELRTFTVWFYLAAAAGDIWRSRLPAARRRELLDELRGAARWSDLSLARKQGRRTAARVALLLVAGRRSGGAVSAYRRVRQALQRPLTRSFCG